MSNYGTFNQDKQTQTTKYYSLGMLSESINTSDNTSNQNINHLNFANQTYFEHFKDSITYCGKSIKASFFFFVHAIWPDLFTQSGSQCIHELSDTIKYKYNKRMEELHLVESNCHDEI